MADMIKFNGYQSNTPLELAYRWTLACTGMILFCRICYFTCENVLPGRIFDDDKAIQINDDLIEKKIQKNILYCAQKGEGFPTHPLFDLFFLCKIRNKDWL